MMASWAGTRASLGGLHVLQLWWHSNCHAATVRAHKNMPYILILDLQQSTTQAEELLALEAELCCSASNYNPPPSGTKQPIYPHLEL